MFENCEYNRLLILAWEERELIQIFDDPQLEQWNIVPAKSSAAASILLQSNPCHVLLADESQFDREGLEGIGWLAEKEHIPILFMADAEPEVVAAAYERGIHLWIPRSETLNHPVLMANALQRVMCWRRLKQSYCRAQKALDHSQHQVDRLVSLLWRTAAMEADKRWYSQRHMLERLDEEIARAGRYQIPLSIALGEIKANTSDTADDDSEIKNVLADSVAAKKRRSDVAGQYGQDGFMLLLSHTPAEGAISCCRRLQHHLEQSIPLHSPACESVRMYFGLATFSSGAATAHRLLRFAEERLEKAKRNGNYSERVVGELSC